MQGRRDFLKKAAILTGGSFLGAYALQRLGRDDNSPPPPPPTVGEECLEDPPFDLDAYLQTHPGESLHYTQEQIEQFLQQGSGLNLTWHCNDPKATDADLLIDTVACFVAYKGQKIITWEKPAKENAKTHHPLFYGYPTVDDIPLKELQVPLTPGATATHRLWHDNITAENFDALEASLPKPPQGKRLHEIAPPPAISDPRHIAHFMYQKESEKLAYNILNWQPDVQPQDYPYSRSNNRFLLHLMATESSCCGRIGPNAWQKSIYKAKRTRTKDGIDAVTHIYGSYGGLSQMGVNNKNNSVTGSLAETPFAVQTRKGKHSWSGLQVNGHAVKNQEDFYANWQAQMLATVYTQLIAQDRTDVTKKLAGKTEVSSAGAFAAMHLLGPLATRNYILHGKTAKDSNGTTAEKYYERFKQYTDDTLYLPPPEVRLEILENLSMAVTAAGQQAMDEKFRIENQWRDSSRLDSGGHAR